MTTITILPEKADSYRALAGEKESTGRTAGEALDALTAQLGDDEGGTLVIVQNHRADRFFDAAQQERLTELMRLHEARGLSTEEARELETLIEAELVGARERAGALAAATAHGEEKLDSFSDFYVFSAGEERVEHRSTQNIVEVSGNEVAEEIRSQPTEDLLLIHLYAAGLPIQKIAVELGISTVTAFRKLKYQQKRLFDRLNISRVD